MKKFGLLLLLSCVLALTSCSMNPLALGFRSSPGIPKREWVNTNPKLIQTSPPRHGSAVSRYTNQGYAIIGYGQTNARQPIDAQNALMLALEKNADVAIFSRKDLGVFSERVAVPVASQQSSGYSQYQNSNRYSSQSQGGEQTTVFTYRDQNYRLFEHKTTLLRKLR